GTLAKVATRLETFRRVGRNGTGSTVIAFEISGVALIAFFPKWASDSLAVPISTREVTALQPQVSTSSLPTMDSLFMTSFPIHKNTTRRMEKTTRMEKVRTGV